MTSIRIVLDTNVLHAGLYSSRGASHLVLRALETGKVKPVISTALLFEYEDILTRKKRELNLSNSKIESILNNLCRISAHHEVYFLWRPCLSDPDDDHILELAVASGTEFIVTFNKKDFKGSETYGVKVITPKELLEKIK